MQRLNLGPGGGTAPQTWRPGRYCTPASARVLDDTAPTFIAVADDAAGSHRRRGRSALAGPGTLNIADAKRFQLDEVVGIGPDVRLSATPLK